MKTLYIILLHLVAAAILTSCSGLSTDASQPTGSPDKDHNPTTGPSDTLPAISDLPRTASGLAQINGESFIESAGATIQGHAATLSLHGSDGWSTGSHAGEAQDGQAPKFAYAVYRFAKVNAPVVGLNITTSSHNVSPMWIALPDASFTRWTYPFEPEFSSAELWNSMTGVDLSQRVSTQQDLLVAVILADDKEDITIYNLELVFLSDVSECTASSNLDDQIHLEWKNPSRSIATLIYRRPIGAEHDAWQQVTPEYLESYVTSYTDFGIELGIEYEYCVRSAFGPRLDFDHCCWSSGPLVKGRTLISSIEFPNIALIEVDSIETVNWFNHLGIIGKRSNPSTDIFAMSTLSFPPGSQWKTYTTEDGLDDVQLAANPATAKAITTFMFTTDNNPYITLCYSTDNGMYSQVAEIDQFNNVSWCDPQEIRQGSHQIIGCFQMSRRIGLLTWNTQNEQLEIYDSSDQIGRHWFDIDELNWDWRILPGQPPAGALDSIYTSSGEILCYTESSTDQIKVFAMGTSDWLDQSPGIIASPGPKICDVMMPYLIPGTGLFYITEDRTSVKLARREFFDPWQLDSQIEIRAKAAPGSITNIAIFCQSQFATRNYVAYIEAGNVYYCLCNSWELSSWSEPILVDDSGTCENIRLIRIGSDEEYHYGLYLTYFTREDDQTMRFHFRVVDNRFIPQL
jgi:hypothetical protein